jgi:hypothetical protein
MFMRFHPSPRARVGRAIICDSSNLAACRIDDCVLAHGRKGSLSLSAASIVVLVDC